MSKSIEVIQYDPNWPKAFKTEAAIIKQALGNNFAAIYHVGSTSVPGLSAKPIIDIIAVVKDELQAIESLEKFGFIYKGEYNIPFRSFFAKKDGTKINLHVFEEGHPEIELNLTFRDYLRAHPSACAEYAKIKENLLSDEASFKKQEGHLFSGYNLGKDAFIRKILSLAGFERLRFLKCTHYEEWEAYHRIRKEQIFDPRSVPYVRNHPSLTAANRFYFVLLKGTTVVAIAHIAFLSETEATMGPLAIDGIYQGKGYGTVMMMHLEKWLRKNGKKVIKFHAAISAEGFYSKLGYSKMLFDGPCKFNDSISLGKLL